MNRGGAILIALSVALAPRITLAEVSMQTQAPAKVEAGQRFNVQLTATAASGDETPSQPKLSAPQNFVVQGPSVSTQYQVTTINGRFEQRQGVTATWLLLSNTVGRFRIGPASVISAGHSVLDKAFIVEVVAAGTLQPQRNRNTRRIPFDPFDPFGDFDLIFGASKLGLKTVDLPIRYAARTYGATQISRFRHGIMLLKMVVFAFFKIKAI